MRSSAEGFVVLPLHLQKKERGRKTVLTMSSMGGVISNTSAEARHLEKAPGFSDGIMVAYKTSKSALNQRESRGSPHEVEGARAWSGLDLQARRRV